jgi:hypothetical protein
MTGSPKPKRDALERLQNAFVHLEFSEGEADRMTVEAVRETRRAHLEMDLPTVAQPEGNDA